MALQGTIDAFPLTDVLQLLASSHKTGRLVLEGDRGTAALWIDEGSVIGGEAFGTASSRAASLVFEMLRFEDASFAFDTLPDDREPDVSVEATPLERCIDDATVLMADWSEIAAVVPSLAHRVVLSAELPDDEITLDAATWAVIAATGSHPVVAALGDSLGLDEYDTCSSVAELVGRGLATIEEPGSAPVASVPEVETNVLGEPRMAVVLRTEADDAEADDRIEGLTDLREPVAEFPERFPIDDLLGDDDTDTDDPWSSPEMEQLEAQRFAAAQTFERVSYDSLPPLESGAGESENGSSDATSSAWNEMVEATSDDTDDTADEVLRQMSKLSPQAAEAIAAALNSVPSRPAPDSEAEADSGESDGPVSFMGTF